MNKKEIYPVGDLREVWGGAPTMSKQKKVTDAVEILNRRYIKGDPKREAAVEAARVHAEVARTIYALRTEAEMSQAELADAVSTTQSVISRLESEEYTGHSLGD